MILPSSGSQLPIINGYPVLGLDSYGDEPILVVIGHGDTGPFRNDEDGAHPLIIQDG